MKIQRLVISTGERINKHWRSNIDAVGGKLYFK